MKRIAENESKTWENWISNKDDILENRLGKYLPK
jgi:hypothetical protein